MDAPLSNARFMKNKKRDHKVRERNRFRINNKLMALVAVLSSFLAGRAQTMQPTVFEEWTSSSGFQTFYQKSVTKTDASKNVYIAGATMNQYGNYDVLV